MGVPRIGRRVALAVFIDERKRVAVDVDVAIVERPRIDRRVGRFRVRTCRLDAVRAEHKVKLPAVGDTVTVVVRVERPERVALPRTVEVHLLLVRLADADRGEVAHEHVLVERGERLRVDIVRFYRRLAVVAELIVDLRVDERHVDRGDRFDLEVGTGDEVRTETGNGHLDEVGTRLVCGDRDIVVRREQLVGRQRVSNAIRSVRVANEVLLAEGVRDEAVDPARHGEGHEIAGRRRVGVGNQRIAVGKARLPAVGHAVAVRIPLGGIGVRVVHLLVSRKTVAVDVGAVDASHSGLGGVLEDLLVVIDVEDVVRVDVGVFHVHLGLEDLRAPGVDLHRARRPDRRLVDADLRGVAPRLVDVALAVSVAVHERDGIVLAIVKAVEDDL